MGTANNFVFESMEGFLIWLTGSGGGSWLLVAWFVSWIMEDFDWWKTINSKLKMIIMLAIAGLLGAGAVWLGRNEDIVAAIDPYFRPLMYAVMLWLANQFAHGKNPLREK